MTTPRAPVPVRPEPTRVGDHAPPAAHSSWFAGGLVALAAALAANTLLGPHLADLVDYPFSATMRNQTVGLEIFSLYVVVPTLLAAALLALRRHPAAGILAVGPTAYVAYMFVQYVVGPEYLRHAPVLALHLPVFVLAVVLLAAAWARTDAAGLPARDRRSQRRWAAVLAGLALFVLSRYLPALAGLATGEPVPAAAREDVSFYWTILLLDLGIVIPATVAATVGLLRSARWAPKALYGVVGWFAFVPGSVAAMQAVMLGNGDAYAGGLVPTLVLSGAAVASVAVAAVLYRPLLSPSGWGSAEAGRGGKAPRPPSGAVVRTASGRGAA